MLICSLLNHEGGVGVNELALMIALFVVALVALYFALHIPRLPEYQLGDEE